MPDRREIGFYCLSMQPNCTYVAVISHRLFAKIVKKKEVKGAQHSPCRNLIHHKLKPRPPDIFSNMCDPSPKTSDILLNASLTDIFYYFAIVRKILRKCHRILCTVV